MASDDMIPTFDERELTIRGSLEKASDLAERYNDVFEARPEIYSALLQWSPIDPVEVLSLTLCIFKISKGDLVQSIVGGVNIGRDSDTIANLCGALSGAIHGAGRIPREWIDGVDRESVNRFRSVAQRMTNLISTGASDSKARAEMILRLGELHS